MNQVLALPPLPWEDFYSLIRLIGKNLMPLSSDSLAPCLHLLCVLFLLPNCLVCSLCISCPCKDAVALLYMGVFLAPYLSGCSSLWPCVGVWDLILLRMYGYCALALKILLLYFFFLYATLLLETDSISETTSKAQLGDLKLSILK